MNQHQHVEEEIDIKELWSIFLRYYRSILFIVIVSTAVSAYIAYFKPSIYSAQTLLKITSERQGYYEDFLMVAPVAQGSEVDDELIIFQSRPIAKKVLEKINVGVRYYTRKNFRTVEMYKSAPFTVTYDEIDPAFYGKRFYLIPIDDKTFTLKIGEERSWWRSFWSKDHTDSKKVFSGKYHYDERIETPWFRLTIHKIYQPKAKTYWFTIVPNESMTAFVQGGVSASTMTKFGSIVSLRFADTVPQRAAEIVNAVAEAYIDQNLELKSKGAKKQLYFIDMQLEAINKTLKGSAQKLQKYKATNVVVDLSSKAQMTAAKLSEFESKLYEVNMQLDILENMLSHLKTQKSSTKFTLDYVPNGNPALMSLIEKIQRAMTKYSALSVSYTENHPGILKLKRELGFLKQSLQDALQNNIMTLKQQKERLLQAITEQKRRLQDVPKQEQQLEQLSRHFMVNEKIYSYLLEKRAETAILASSTISNTRVVQEALPPSTPVKPKRKLIVLIGFMLGLIMGVLQAFIRHFFDNTIKHQEQIEKLTDIPLYGTLPLIKRKAQQPSYNEAVRSLWINLAFVGASSKGRVISVTSSISGEGKTFTIYHLSRMIAKSSEHKVIVIDMDMRRATLHKKFGMENGKKGVSTVLNGSYTVQEAIMHTKFPHLDVMFSGPKAPNPTRLIMSDAFDSMIEVLSKEYDYILIDTPPIGIVSDAMKVMHRSNLVLFMLKAEYSKKEFIKTLNRLDQHEEINFGIVLNGVDLEKSYYYYGYGYHHGEQYYLKDSEG